MLRGDGDPQRFARAAFAVSLVAAVPFLFVLWDGGAHPLRTALGDRTFSHFYDIQARALMHGHLDVPRGSLAFEAFRVGGRDYLYFPPLPSILRMPVLALTDRFDGRLTAPSMLLAWVVTMVTTSLLVWRVRHLLHPGAPLRRAGLLLSAGLVGVVGGGSAVVYLAALPWVYHEAFMWTVATSIGAAWATIGVLEAPTARRLLLAGGFALAAMLTRVTVGWAWCLALLAIAALARRRPRWRRSNRQALAIAAAGALPLVLGIALNWAKFRHPFMIPLDQQLVAHVSVNRRRALDANGGGMTGPQFAPTTLLAYLRPDGVRLTSVFPFVTLPARPARVIGSTTFDEVYRTGSIVGFMPALVALSVAGIVATFRRGASRAEAMLRIPALGAAAGTGAVVLFGYVAHRYLAEFVPGLVVLATIGLVAVEARSRRWAPRRASLVFTALGVLALFGVIANTAVGLSTARTVRRGDALVDLLETRVAISGWTGHPNDGYVSRGADLDVPAPAEHLRVVGDCASVWLATGNQYEPWIAVEVSELTVPVDPAAGSRSLVHFDGAVDSALSIELDGNRQRLVLDTGDAPTFGAWAPVASATVVVGADLERARYTITSELMTTTVPMTAWDEAWVSRPVLASAPDAIAGATPFCDDL